MKTQLDNLIKDLSTERISAGFWSSVKDALTDLASNVVDVQYHSGVPVVDILASIGASGSIKDTYNLSKSGICDQYRVVAQAVEDSKQSLSAKGFSREQIETICRWSMNDFKNTFGFLDGKQVTNDEYYIPIGEDGGVASLSSAIKQLAGVKPFCAPAVEQLYNRAVGFVDRSATNLQSLANLIGRNLSHDALRDEIATRVEEENREEQLHVY